MSEGGDIIQGQTKEEANGQQLVPAADAENGILFNQENYARLLENMHPVDTDQETSSDQDSPEETQVWSSLKEWDKIMDNVPEAELSNNETAPFSDSPEA